MADPKIIGWIDDLCCRWGSAKRGIMSEVVSFSSVLGRAKDGWSIASAADGAHRPTPPEVMCGDALEVAIAIRKAIQLRELNEDCYETLFVHYVIDEPVKVKKAALGIGWRRYYRRLEHAHRALKPHLEPPVDWRRDKITGTNGTVP